MFDIATTTTRSINPLLDGIVNPVAVYRSTAPAASTDSIALFRALDAMLTAPPEYNGLRLQATPDAYDNAARFLESASKTMTVPIPEFTPDGEGGIDIEWEHQGRRLALSCYADGTGDFVSWREPAGRYDGREATPELLNEKLDWLTS